ncbi:NAD(P)/FAD-dependent oxidoreductase [Arthrobacter sp. EPSL27]|uniref:NAD(P)/FAD-dependent oxidoreductase n=1 Tax=Arthrobacter sp. EPSL27 TaxID=1745378 RepID=UPI0007492AC7|nr:FAD-dependent oxidoreductase [Arthrobacter sp. EPSL27]KUM37411.1 hypothetical protein AR539_09110 [Arthrobacter sp. EPSL27]
MDYPENIVIIGGSLAGGTAAVTLREEGYKGRVTLVGEESHAPYERPALSKDFLANGSLDAILTRPIVSYTDRGIETKFGSRAVKIDVSSRSVELSSREQLPFDRLLLATGARNRLLPLPGLDLQGVFSLRTADDAIALRRAIRPGGRAVVLGMGFIGTEVSAALRSSGMEVTAVEMLSAPLVQALGNDMGSVLKDVHAEHGVDMIFEDRAIALGGEGHVKSVLTASGRTLECDLVVFGFGTEPNSELAVDAGLEVQGGIRVDEFCRTSVDGIYAAGDVTNHFHPLAGRHLRVEHWQNAILQAKVAARNMLGQMVSYDDVHWFWSSQYTERIHYAGFHGPWDRYVTRGSVSARDFSVFYLDGRRLVGVAGCNRPRDVRTAMELMKSGISLNDADLASDDVSLKSLVQPAAVG